MLQTVNFDCSFQSSLDEFSEETFDGLEDGVNRYSVSKAFSVKDVVLTFLPELMAVKKNIRYFLRSCTQKHQHYQYGIKD